MFKGLFKGEQAAPPPPQNLGPTKPIEDLAAPWVVGQDSWHDRIAASIKRRGEADIELDLIGPDDNVDPRSLAGGMDYYLNDPRKSPQTPRVRALVAAMRILVKQPTDAALAHFYRLALEPGAINVADPFRWACRELADEFAKVVMVGRRIARESPDAEAVKIALPLLGLADPSPSDRDLIFTLGAHDEFTPYAVDAIRLSVRSEGDILKLAQGVKGWGRIQASWWFKDTANPELKDWLLRQAHRNTVGPEHNALFCAQYGDLARALAASDSDDDLLDAAGELIRAIMAFWESSGIYDYPQAAVVCERLLALTRDRGRLTDLYTAHSILRFLDEPRANWKRLTEMGWSLDMRNRVRAAAQACLTDPRAKGVVEHDLLTAEKVFDAWQVAGRIGLDAWPLIWTRSQAGEPLWADLMLTERPDRVEQVLALAAERLDLEAVSAGPMEASAPHLAGDEKQIALIVQQLSRFPGVGWPLLKIGLRARSAQLRFLALRSLYKWGAGAWMAPARALIETARSQEPNAELRARMERALKGKSPE